MDTTQTITHVSLCAGYGGIDIGLKRAIPSLRTIAFSEIEAFPVANLVAKMEAGLLDAAPIWTNLKTFPWASFRGQVDILSGGYPCQPFSTAGKQLGTKDPRHLWPFIADGIRAMQPGVCFFENVEGHISLGLREVISELESIGYRTTWGIFSAAEVGAPHRRKRVFIMAESRSQRGEAGLSGPQQWQEGQSGVADNGGDTCWPSSPGEPQHEWEPPRVVGNTENKRDINKTKQDFTETGVDTDRASKGKSVGQAQPPLGRDANGSAGGLDYAKLYVTCDNRTDELRLLGNGVVPATAELAFRILSERL